MSKLEKEIKRLKSKPKDYTYDEMKNLLIKLGFYEYNKGKTPGSKVRFINKDEVKIDMHKPHPDNIIKMYVINNIIKILEKEV